MNGVGFILVSGPRIGMVTQANPKLWVSRVHAKTIIGFSRSKHWKNDDVLKLRSRE